MNRKWVGVAVAVALAALGTWVIVSFVGGAEDRALEGQETVTVLVVDSVIPAGSAAQDIRSSVRVETVPAKVQAAGSLQDLDALQSLESLVAAIDLLPGEQIVASRFIAIDVLEERDRVEIPEGMLEITLSLSPQRAVGGVLRPGDEVAVFASFEPEAVASPEAGDGADVGSLNPVEQLPSTTKILLDKALITNVQVEELPQSNTSEDRNTATLGLSPSGNLLVTLAMEPVDAERFVYTAEFGTVWLADAARSLNDAATSVQDRTTVYDDPASGG